MTRANDVKYPVSSPESGEETGGVKAPCRGWIQIFSHYVDYYVTVNDDIAVGYKADLYLVGGGSESLVESIEVFYENLKQEDAGVNGNTPPDAVKNGNPRVMIGGNEGYPCGQYKLTLTPKIAYGKFRLKRTPEEDGTYIILNTAGVDSGMRADNYIQAPVAMTVETAWSETFELRRNTPTSPQVVEFVWADFKTWDNITTARITGTGNISAPSLEATESCMNTISARMVELLGENWKQEAQANAFFPIHPRIRYWAFTLINKTEELLDRKVRITNPGRSAKYQMFLRQRYKQCHGAKAAAEWESNHQYGLAFDTGYGASMTESPPAGTKTDLQVLTGKAIGLEWGGDWSDPDRPHFEYPGANDRRDDYRVQLNGDNPTTITYGTHTYVQNP